LLYFRLTVALTQFFATLFFHIRFVVATLKSARLGSFYHAPEKIPGLQPVDVYVTRHSEISQAIHQLWPKKDLILAMLLGKIISRNSRSDSRNYVINFGHLFSRILEEILWRKLRIKSELRIKNDQKYLFEFCSCSKNIIFSPYITEWDLFLHLSLYRPYLFIILPGTERI
jgi:hypothetical protein